MRHRFLCTAFLLCTALCALAAGCSSTIDPGLSIDVKSEAPRVAGASSPVITSDLGYAVTITGGYLATGTVEVIACPPTAMEAILDFLDPIREAHAHAVSSPTRLGSPLVEPLVGGGEGVTDLGSLAPPPGRYCGAQYAIDAADDDAMGLPEAGGMIGKSLFVQGTWSRAGGAPVGFALSSSERVAADLAIDALELGEGASREATLTFSKAMDRWFDGVDLAATTADEQAHAVLANVRASIAVRAQ